MRRLSRSIPYAYIPYTLPVPGYSTVPDSAIYFNSLVPHLCTRYRVRVFQFYSGCVVGQSAGAAKSGELTVEDVRDSKSVPNGEPELFGVQPPERARGKGDRPVFMCDEFGPTVSKEPSRIQTSSLWGGIPMLEWISVHICARVSGDTLTQETVET